MGWGIINLVPGNPEAMVCLINKEPTGTCLDIVLNTLKELLNPLATNLDSNTAYKNPLINSILNNQISGVIYVKGILSKFSLVKTINAQGYGFNTGANAVQKLWIATRNLSYTLIVLAVIVMSFMIMFRVKISPQIVISVQSALPNVIFTIVLITFSYAIAGFAIDLMYVVIGLISQLLIASGLTNLSFADMFGSLNTSYVGGMFYLMYAYWVAFMYTAGVAFFSNLASFILGILIFIFSIIAILAIIFWSIKIIYVLLKNFALIMLTIAMGPLEILAGAFTGKLSFGGWFRKLLSYLAVYPVMGLLLFFSFFFLVQGGNADSKFASSVFGNPAYNYIGNNTWRPPFSGFALADDILWVVVSFVVFSNITKASEIIQAAIAGKPFAYGSAIGEAQAPIAGGSLYGLGRIAENKWPEPVRWIMSKTKKGVRPVPDGWADLADSINRPIQTVSGIFKGKG